MQRFWSKTSKDLLIRAESLVWTVNGSPLPPSVAVPCGPGGETMHTVSMGMGPVSTVSDLKMALAKALAPPLVLLHGYAAASCFWFRNEPFLSTLGRPVLLVDLLGHGLSSRPPFPKHLGPEAGERFFLDAFVEWRVSLGLQGPISLLGHSLGGYLAVVHALEDDMPLNKLLLISPVGIPRPPEQGTVPQSRLLKMFRAAWNKGVTPQSLIRGAGPRGKRLVRWGVERRFGRVMSPAEVDAIADFFFHAAAATSSGEYALNSILAPGAYARKPLIDRFDKMPKELPILFAYGEHDWMDANAGRYVARSAPHWHCRTVEAAGHQISIENPTGFANMVGDFLTGQGFEPRHLVRRRVKRENDHEDDF